MAPGGWRASSIWRPGTEQRNTGDWRGTATTTRLGYRRPACFAQSRRSLLAGDPERALRAAEAALAVHKEAADDADMAVATDLEHVADTLAALKENERARVCLEEAASICVAAVSGNSDRATALRRR